MDVVRKTPRDYGVQTNLTEHADARVLFQWSDVSLLREGMGLHADIAEADYPTLRTLADVVGDVEKNAAKPGLNSARD